MLVPGSVASGMLPWSTKPGLDVFFGDRPVETNSAPLNPAGTCLEHLRGSRLHATGRSNGVPSELGG